MAPHRRGGRAGAVSRAAPESRWRGEGRARRGISPDLAPGLRSEDCAPPGALLEESLAAVARGLPPPSLRIEPRGGCRDVPRLCTLRSGEPSRTYPDSHPQPLLDRPHLFGQF